MADKEKQHFENPFESFPFMLTEKELAEFVKEAIRSARENISGANAEMDSIPFEAMKAAYRESIKESEAEISALEIRAKDITGFFKTLEKAYNLALQLERDQGLVSDAIVVDARFPRKELHPVRRFIEAFGKSAWRHRWAYYLGQALVSEGKGK